MSFLRRPLARGDVVLLLAIAAVVVSVAVAMATSRAGSLDDRARGIDAQLRCPTCQGLSIADSPATSAVQMRALVREQLESGASDDEVRAFFVARYGRWILLDPPAAGADLALWLAPAVILVAGAVLVVRRSRVRGGELRPDRRWRSVTPLPAPGLATALATGAMVLALVVPIVVAVGPRLAGREVSGGAVGQSVPTIEDLEAFVRAEPGDVAAIVALGDALLVAGRSDEAAERYKAALAIDEASVPALLGVGTILLAADRPDAAGPVFDRILVIAPDQPDALLFRAVSRRRLVGSLPADARRDVERFLAVAPSDDPRREMATRLLAEDDRGSPGTSPPASSASPLP